MQLHDIDTDVLIHAISPNYQAIIYIQSRHFTKSTTVSYRHRCSRSYEVNIARQCDMLRNTNHNIARLLMERAMLRNTYHNIARQCDMSRNTNHNIA